jgi:site-specific recombinase XerD
MLRKANVPSTVRIHDVRHSAASLMLAQGVPIREVQELLGHATVHTTLRIYAHVIGDGKRRAIDGLTDALMGEKS